jgi:hypothetical protein
MNNNNNNNNNNHVSIDFSARLLQEMMAIRTEISQQGLQLNVLNTGLRQQLTAPLNEGRNEQSSGLAGDNGTASILDPLYKSRMLANVNQSGPRVIAANITGKSGASPVQRFNAMLQHLNRICNGPETLALTTRQLVSRRAKLHRVAKKVVQAILVLHPTITHWSALDHLQQDQLYYCLALENVVLNQENLRIGLCKKQWCARLLLSQAFKAVRSSQKRSDAAAAAADIAAAELAISAPQDDQAVGGSVVSSCCHLMWLLFSGANI